MEPSIPVDISEEVNINHDALRYIFRNCADIVFRPLKLSDHSDILLVYIEELTDSNKLEQIISACMISRDFDRLKQYKIVVRLSEIVAKVLKGSTAIFLDGKPYAYLADLTTFKQRSINEPSNEASIRGPREAFTEDLKTNLSMIRRKISNSKLKIESHQSGELTNTEFVIAYIEDKVKPELLQEVTRRLHAFRTNQLLDSSYIEEFIEDKTLSLFPQIQNTERPDTVSASLLAGRVAIIVDGSPKHCCCQ